ncbi:hypothetical protein BOTCAL_0061g00350 [Botryotinia calthae]|uniref:Uncharacterized protein n=1 Tax=Botryotinia calthae TaxID=38488 RepID=A0A4Y8D9V6_9HELO|nr:hypothetical protein BOTCAL_0061g00350 [Botryotinia calthae]
MLANLNAQETGSDCVELFNEVKGFWFLGLKRPVRSGMNPIETIREEKKYWSNLETSSSGN